MSNSLNHYLKTIESSIRVGNATEHTHRPALKALLESFDLNVTATNEPKRITCGAPDFIVTRDNLTIGYVEAKDVGKSLNATERTDQLKRYFRALNNLILTDYLEFRWYVDGEMLLDARLATSLPNGKLQAQKGGTKAVETILKNYLDHRPQEIKTSKDLAKRMARLTQIIRDVIVTTFETNQASNLLQGWRDAFSKVLIADMHLPEKTLEYADMFAQTLAYGLFTARVMDETTNTFTRQGAQYLIPKTNPFLRDFFIQISGPQLDDEPFASFVDDLVNLLVNTDMTSVLTDFGHRAQQEDPIIHFYETFLAAYDPKLRETRGVYYTPEPVVNYIVRSVDYLLKTSFNCSQGLADYSKITIANLDPNIRVKGKKQIRKTIDIHKVLILDPATGTGTFLYTVIDHIRQQFMQQGNAGMWPGYVRNHLLPRLFGFELLMAPYAVAHFKLSLQLAGRDLPISIAKQWAYHPINRERLGVYLTNSLEEPHEMTGMPLFTQWVADETNAANEVKKLLPVLVVMGNPPYSNFGQMNKGDWILNLLKEYKKGLNEKKLNLDDDFIKFIRFGQWRIERSGVGILAFVTNNTYIDGITHRQMRKSLMESFTEIFILNLHGSSMRYEEGPNGEKDENVFDIRQGVSIGIFVKNKKKTSNIDNAKVYYSDLWGLRKEKYETLKKFDVSATKWVRLKPKEPWWFFVNKEDQGSQEYDSFSSVTSIFQVFGNGIGTDRDKLFYDFDNDILSKRIEKFYSCDGLIPPFSKDFKVKDSSSYPITSRRKSTDFSATHIIPCLYRTFDTRWLYYNQNLISRPAYDVMQHLIKPNIALLVTRQVSTGEFKHVFVSKTIVDRDPLSLATRERTQVFPLYLYPNDAAARQSRLFDVSSWPHDERNGGRIPNLDPNFVAELEQKINLKFTPNSIGDLENTFGPEDIFHFLYSSLYSPNYRCLYKEFLKIDFPRIPLPANVELFCSLRNIGHELVSLHLLESPLLSQFITQYPVVGNNFIERGFPKYSPPSNGRHGRIAINETQYFEGVNPDVWEFSIGGYQLAQKWLKDRRGMQLSYDDLTHYKKMLVAIKKTKELMGSIDNIIQTGIA